jgi:outer membrane protein OmpA-like peptidoglycan-associated protein
LNHSIALLFSMNRSIFFITVLLVVFSSRLFAQELVPYRCVDADDLFSSGELSCKINFENKLDREVVIYWIDGSGANIEYASLSAGESYTQASFISHRWLVADEEGNCLMVFVARYQNQNAIIKDKYSKWNEVLPREDLVLLACSEDLGLRSINGDTATGIYFINKTNKTLKTFWLNYEGKRVFYNTLAPKSGYMQATYATHPWLITDEDDQCVCLFVPQTTNASNAIIEVLPPAEEKRAEEALYVGKSVVLEQVYFVQSKSEILPSSYAALDKLYKLLLENPVEIQIEGHTDSQGNPDLNLSLSEDRADAIKKYLVNKGIDQKRIATKGFGGTKPIASNAKEETRKLNRRVEFRVIE